MTVQGRLTLRVYHHRSLSQGLQVSLFLQHWLILGLRLSWESAVTLAESELEKGNALSLVLSSGARAFGVMRPSVRSPVPMKPPCWRSHVEIQPLDGRSAHSSGSGYWDHPSPGTRLKREEVLEVKLGSSHHSTVASWEPWSHKCSIECFSDTQPQELGHNEWLLLL